MLVKSVVPIAVIIVVIRKRTISADYTVPSYFCEPTIGIQIIIIGRPRFIRWFKTNLRNEPHSIVFVVVKETTEWYFYSPCVEHVTLSHAIGTHDKISRTYPVFPGPTRIPPRINLFLKFFFPDIYSIQFV